MLYHLDLSLSSSISLSIWPACHKYVHIVINDIAPSSLATRSRLRVLASDYAITDKIDVYLHYYTMSCYTFLAEYPIHETTDLVNGGQVTLGAAYHSL